MKPILHVLFLGLAMMVIGAITDARAQAPAPATVEGNIYSVIYAEVMPTSRGDGAALLKRYREATRNEDGNLRCEVVSRIEHPHQFVILEAWKDRKAFEAHGQSTTTREFRDGIQAIRNAPLDELRADLRHHVLHVSRMGDGDERLR